VTKHTNKPSTRALTAALFVVNLAVFTIGVAVAGTFAADRTPASKAVAAKRPAAALAAGAGALAGAVSKPAPLPIAGKGMWIWQFDKIAHGDPYRIVRSALAHGLTHIYVRSGSSNSGLAGWRDVARILPVAHAHGLKVIAWDFPYLRAPGGDVHRAVWVLSHSVKGQKVDGFAADLETRSEGTVLTRTRASRYARWLREAAPDAFLILVPPRPNPYTVSFYPYDVLVPRFDAVAPMVYWGRRAPATVTEWAIRYLARFGKPVAPIGQSFDMGPEGGPKGAPRGIALVRFMNEARREGAIGVSFWSWQHTPARLWRTIRGYDWQPRGRS
jgi:hypothetical protein